MCAKNVYNRINWFRHVVAQISGQYISRVMDAFRFENKTRNVSLEDGENEHKNQKKKNERAKTESRANNYCSNLRRPLSSFVFAP